MGDGQAVTRRQAGLTAACLLLAGGTYPPARAQSRPDLRLPLDRDLAFIDGTGKTVSIRDFPGQWLLVYFGYMHCADLCPLGLSVLAEAVDMIGPAAKLVQPLFITVDPEHDRGEALLRFSKEFHERLIGLTGTGQQIREAADSMGVRYTKVDLGGGDYSVDHSSSYSLIDPARKTVITFRRTEAHLAAAEVVRAMKAAGVPLDSINGALR